MKIDELRTWLIGQVAERRGVDARAIDARERFSRYGLDSAGATAMLAQLGPLLGRTLSPVLVWEHPTIEGLARHLCGIVDVDAHAPAAQRARVDGEPIAIVGMACRFPQAPDVAAYWRLLCDGVDAISDVPRERWDMDALHDPDPGAPGKMTARQGGFVDDVDRFDPLFFGISPREAAHMDPQQRIMLELAWEALEDAALVPERLRGSATSVFFGAIWSDYGTMLYRESGRALTQHSVTGTHNSIIANRVSYALGLQGASMSIDTACSSALVAIHQACESLRNGESTLALAGGVNLNLVPESTIGVCKFGGLSPDSRCFSFDARANGYVRSEGGGVIALKLLSRAIADGDPIHCVIRGSAVNNDGASNGLTAPNPLAQEAVLRAAYERAGVDPTRVQYVEAHGTGTFLGDPIEAKALGAVLGRGRSAGQPLIIGSAKSNIGHLESAAGIAGVIKAALCIEKGELPASLHFDTPNPHIPFAELNLRVQTARGPWPTSAEPATAGVSAFGFGGTNAHVVLQAWQRERAELLTLAAASDEALGAAAATLTTLIDREATLAEHCSRAAGLGSDGRHRLAVTATTTAELERKLERFAAGERPAGLSTGVAATAPRPAFVFSGFGSQWVGMARTLLAEEPRFAATMARCDVEVRRQLGWSLVERLQSDDGAALDAVDVACPAIVCFQMALAATWRGHGVEPAAIVGHSIGEIAAAQVAGIVELEEAVAIVCAQMRALRRIRGRGAMGLCALSWQAAGAALAGREGSLVRAIEASPDATVLAGDEAALVALFAELTARQIFCRQMTIDIAAHGPHCDELRDELTAALATIRPRPPRLPFFSGTAAGTLTADGVTPAFDADHWMRNLCDPVRFAGAVGRAIASGFDTFVEISPHPLVKSAVESCLQAAGRPGIVVAAQRRHEDERAALCDGLGQLFTLGQPLASGGDDDGRLQLLPLSGKSAEALRAQADRFAAWLERDGERGFSDVCHTAATGRTHFEERLAIVCATAAEARPALLAAASGDPRAAASGRAEARRPRVAFLFTGQGSQYAGMGRALYASEPRFAAELDRCAAILAPLLDRPLLSLLHPDGDDATSLLDETAYTQPALFAIEWALQALWRSWGVEPAALLGHSVGEYVAACVAGVLSLEDGLALIAARGRLMQALPRGGAMASVAAPPARVLAAIAPFAREVSIAAYNGPQQVVISGAGAAIDAICAALSTDGIKATRLAVSHAFHSPAMDPMLDRFERVVAGVTLRAPSLPLISNLTGTVAGAEVTEPGYWRRHVREAVRFSDGMQRLHDDGIELFLEIGPRPTLLGMGAATLPGANATWLASLRPGRDERRTMLESLAQLYVRGAEVDWSALAPATARRRSALPSYPFQRQRHWVDMAQAAQAGVSRADSGHPLLGGRVAVAGPGAVFEASLSVQTHSFLGDHQVFDRVVVPGAAYLELAQAAARAHLGPGRYRVELLLQSALLLPAHGARLVQLVLAPPGDDGCGFVLYSRDAGDGEAAWTAHATGSLFSLEAAAPVGDLESLQARLSKPVDVTATYARLATIGLGYGPEFQGVTALYAGEREVLARVELPAGADEAARYELHPALLDAGLQALAAALGDDGSALYLPFEVPAFAVWSAGLAAGWVHARVTDAPAAGGEVAVGDVRFFDDDGRVVAEVVGLRLKRTEAAALERAQQAPAPSDWLYRIEWRPADPRAEATTPSGHWLVLADDARRARTLAARLEAAGASCTTLAVADAAAGPPVLAVDGPLAGVVCLVDGAGDGEDVAAAAEQSSLALLHLVQSLVRQAPSSPPRLWLATTGAQAVGSSAALALAAAPLWGLGRVLMEEHPELACTLVDLDPAHGDAEAADGLWRELTHADDENQVALRDGKRLVARLARAARPRGLEVPAAPSYRLETARKGLLDQLRLVADERRAPAAGQLEIEVLATGLNFRDVLNALGQYPGEAGPLGNECAGVVTYVGAGVTRLAVGDRVMALAQGSFSRFVTVDARLVAPAPAGMSMEQAAAIPIVFLTAWYALVDLGRVQPGEQLLVHAAAGGVGMAAIQVAHWLGATVLATASQPKWPLVRSLGVAAVADSRTLAFADAFAGERVDVVLNALAGPFVDASIKLLGAGGRFLEMGKTDVRVPSAAPAGVSYQAFDLMEAGPDRIAEMFAQLAEGFAGGQLRPLPVKSFRITEAEAAFRFMSQAKHVGKIVLTPVRATVCAPDSTVLVTGGLGALGLHVARWLVEDQGVRHLVLMGRTAPAAERLPAIEALRRAGARVTVAQADVADAAQMTALLAAIPAELPLRGVVHAAGLLDDGVVAQQEAARFVRVLVPKIRGAWNLHLATRDQPLDFFVMFSSVASLLGSAGQANYAAGNAFLDGLAHHRRALGLPGLSLNWGPWADGGMAEALDAQQRQRLGRQGFGSVTARQGLALLGQTLARDEAQLGVLPLDLGQRARAATETAPLWRELIRARPSAPRAATSARSWLDELAALTPAARGDEARAVVAAEVAKVLSLPSLAEVPHARPLKELGLDSLMAVELRNGLAARVGRALPATLVFDHPTVALLGDYLVGLAGAATPRPVVAKKPAAVATRGDEPIAIVGMSCRFPGADSPEALWQLLAAGIDAVAEVPADRWNVDDHFDADPDAAGKMYTRWGGFLDGVDRFDPGFFGIAPREAMSLDPQQRLLLEVSWEALERAGQSPERLMGSLGSVFIGICNSDYGARLLRGNDPREIDAYTCTGSISSVAAGRLSYVLGLRGPSMPIDTACSSSAVAVHLACQSLRAGESDLALAGGVNLVLSPEATIYFSRLRAMSADGRCKTFDASADGYVRSDGCGVVVLKRLTDALASGDPILAVLRGSAVNQDGRSNGLTAPNGPAQQAVIRSALAQAGVAPAQVGYVEAHGTGTALGDPIELQALDAVMSQGRTTPLRVGSIKSNFGHAEGAAGVAGLIKTVLALGARQIPASLHFRNPNPHVPWDRLSVTVPTALEPWASDEPRRAGVSSFGISGTNAHLVVEEAPPRERRSAPARAAELVVLSAKQPAALTEMARRWSETLARTPLQLGDVAFTASRSRGQFEHRLAIVATSTADLCAQLADFAAGHSAAASAVAAAVIDPPPSLAFRFVADAALSTAELRELTAAEPAFAAALQACDAAITGVAGWSLLVALSDGALLEQPAQLRARTFAVAVALAALWRAWGVEPAALVADGASELAAAVVAGVLELATAARLVWDGAPLPATTPVGDLPRRPQQPDAGALTLELRPGSPSELLAQLGALWMRGAVVDWSKLQPDGACVPLPTYPWQRQRYWIDAAPRSSWAPDAPPLLGAAVRSSLHAGARFWPVELASAPAGSSLAIVVELLLAAAGQVYGDRPLSVSDLIEHAPLPPGLRDREAQLVLVDERGGSTSFRLSSRALAGDGDWTAHASGRVAPTDGPPPRWQLGEGEVLLPIAPTGESGSLTAAVVDGCFAALDPARTPVAIASLRLHRRPAGALFCHPRGDGWSLVDDAGQLIAEAVGAQLRRRPRSIAEQDRWLLALAWQRDLTPAAPRPAAPGRWIVLADGSPVVDALVERLAGAGDDVLRLSAGGAAADALASAIQAAFADGKRCRGLLHLASLDEAATGEPPTAAAHGCGSALAAVQALARLGWRDLPRLWLITRGAQALADDRDVAVAQAPLWGLGRVIALEQPELACTRVDLGAGDDAGQAAALADELARDLADDELALRDGQRWRARLRRQAPATATPVVLRADRSYLVTGGLGGLGLALAERLVESGARHLVLLGRSGATTATQMVALARLRAAGADVSVVAADVADRSRMAQLVDEIAPPLAGVVHAAGLLDDGLVAQLDRARLVRVLAPKVAGAWNLHLATRDRPLDFFVLYSSAAALLGSPGQGNYAAANAFLDALAELRRRAGLPGLSLGFGPFRDVGMAQASDRRLQRLEGRGLAALAPDDGLDVLERLLSSDVAQLAVLPLDIRQWLDFHPHAAGSSRLAELLADAAPAQNAVPQWTEALRAAAPSARTAQLVQSIREQAAEVLRLDVTAIDPATPLTGLGLDSLMGLELKNRLEARVGLPLSPTLLWTYPTIAAVARHLLARLFPVEVVAAPATAVVDVALAALSDDEANALLERELAELAHELD